MFNITKYSLWFHKLSAQVVSLHTKCEGAFSPTFLLYTTFHNLYSSEIQSRLIIKHDNTSSVKEENRLCKNKTDKLVLLYIGGWGCFTIFPFVKRKRSSGKWKHADKLWLENLSSNVHIICVLRNDCTYPSLKYYKSNFARGSTNERFIPNRFFFTLLYSYFQFCYQNPVSERRFY